MTSRRVTYLAILMRNVCCTRVPRYHLRLCVTEDEVRCIYSVSNIFTTPPPPRGLANTFEKVKLRCCTLQKMALPYAVRAMYPCHGPEDKLTAADTTSFPVHVVFRGLV